MTNATAKDKAIERVAKLLELAKGTSNEHEAAAAAAKAQEILLAHNLDMSSVQDQKTQEGAVQRDFDNTENYAVGRWRVHLMNGIAKATCCEMVHMKLRGRSVRRRYFLFGKRENVDVAVYMFEYLQRELIKISPRPIQTATSASFRLGAVYTVSQRLAETLQEFQNASEQTQALVHVQNADARNLLETVFPRTRKRKSSHVGDYEAFQRGVQAGKDIQIRRGVSERNVGGQALLG